MYLITITIKFLYINYKLHSITWKNVCNCNQLQLQITITPTMLATSYRLVEYGMLKQYCYIINSVLMHQVYIVLSN